MRAIKQLSAALRRTNQPKGGVPEDIRLLFGLDRMIHHLAAYEKARRKPKPDAIRKHSSRKDDNELVHQPKTDRVF